MLRPRRGGRWVVWGGDACVAHGTNFRLERRVVRTTPELRQASTQAWQSDPSYSRVDPGGQPGGGRARATCVVRRPRPDPPSPSTRATARDRPYYTTNRFAKPVYSRVDPGGQPGGRRSTWRAAVNLGSAALAPLPIEPLNQPKI